MKSLALALAVAACAASSLVLAYLAYADAAPDYFSQFRCEGDCPEGSGCPYCDAP